MGQKVNPISLRLEKTNRHFDSCWYSDYNYTNLLLQDLKIKNYLKTILHQIQFPEGRVSIENLPNKTNISLFYHNPSNSRRKKNIRFQLQNYKDNNKNTKNKTKSFQKRYFSFPKQKHLQYTKNKQFTLAHQGLEGWKSFLTIPLYETKKIFLLQNYGREDENYTKKAGNPTKDLQPNAVVNKAVTKRDKKITEYSKIKEIKKNCLVFQKDESFFAQQTFNKDMVSTFLLEKPLLNKNLFSYFVLQFVYTSISVKEKNFFDKKWAQERFFVRYLLAQLYSRFLQNKSVCTKETLRNLYQFYLFFQQKRRIQKEKTLQEKHLEEKTKSNNNVQKKSYLQKHNTNVYKHFSSVQNKEYGGLNSLNLVYKSHLEKLLSKQYNNFFNLHFFRSLTEKQGAFFLVQEIIYYLERKLPFRRIKTQILREIPHYKRIKGIRIACSGRVGGRSKKAQRSKTQSVKIGQTSLGVFSSKIDFAFKSAFTRFGLIGVKVWVCYQ